MKISKFFAAVFGLLGICVAAYTVNISFASIDSEPVLRTPPEAAHSRVVQMMDAFCEGDYQTAQSLLYGSTELGADREAADAVGAVIWEAFQDSMTYELVGECYATNSGLSQNIRITTMDIDSVTAYVEANAKTLLEETVQQRIDASENLDEIYDEENQYRDEFVMEVLCEAARQGIENNSETVETEVTLNLVWADDQWWVVSNDQLLKAVSGGIVG